jgi:hypothetical protein
MDRESQACLEAEKAGFDLTLIEANLQLTPEQRARNHDQALGLVLELDRIRHERKSMSSGAFERLADSGAF